MTVVSTATIVIRLGGSVFLTLLGAIVPRQLPVVGRISTGVAMVVCMCPQEVLQVCVRRHLAAAGLTTTGMVLLVPVGRTPIIGHHLASPVVIQQEVVAIVAIMTGVLVRVGVLGIRLVAIPLVVVSLLTAAAVTILVGTMEAVRVEVIVLTAAAVVLAPLTTVKE